MMRRMPWIPLALLLLLAWGGVRLFGGYPAPDRTPLCLRRGEWATLEAAGETLFPAGGPVPPSGREAGVAAYVDRLVAASQPRQRLLIRLLLFLVEHATLLFPAPGLSGWRRFSSLDAGQREAVVASWQKSRLFPRRLVFTTLRAICTLGYLSDPSVQRALRVDPPEIETPVVEADLWIPRVGESRSTIALSREDLTPETALPLAPLVYEERG